jgi:hypothetical protein
MKFRRLCPLVVVEINRRQGRGIGDGEGNVMVSGLFGLYSGGRKLSIWAEFLILYVGSLHYDEVLIKLGRLRIAQTLEVNFGRIA